MGCDDREHLFEAGVLLRRNAVVYQHAYKECFFRRQSTPKLLCINIKPSARYARRKEEKCAPSNSRASNTSMHVTNTLSSASSTTALSRRSKVPRKARRSSRAGPSFVPTLTTS